MVTISFLCDVNLCVKHFRIAREVNMRQLMQRQMDRLVSNCENITTVDFQDMLQIKTLYLIKQFGIKE